MATREGRKTPTGSEIDDWFDLLDEEASALPPKPPGPATEVSRRVTPVPVAEQRASDSWDWDMETPVVTAQPPPEAHPDEEFTDFGRPPPLPVAIPAATASISNLPGVEGSPRRFQGTMMFGATPEAPDNLLVPPTTAPPPTAPSPTPLPPAPRTPPPVPAEALTHKPSSVSPLRGRTPIPRAAVPRAVPQGFAVPAPAHNKPLASSMPPPHVPRASVLEPADVDDLEFQDVSAPRGANVARAERPALREVPRADKPTPVHSIPASTVSRPPRAQPTPVVNRDIPPEAQRSPLPPRVDAIQPRPSQMPPSTRREMVDRFELGDFTGALSLAETLLEADRTDGEAREIAETSRTKLRAIYTGRLGSLDQVPVMMIPHAELRWLALDHRAGFVLSLVDGTSSIDEIIDVSTMAQLEVLRTLYNLLSQNVISLRRPRR